ncbi:sugar phosphate isomerase/epimerase [Catalinimonas alkaloidigena]|uniref:sugar phosphate isomerase/epimerase family protein n=1 Tax=Catalinimonas alkaloidigena TaxID=1075417 RepID=UPI002405F483|nr:sugar phosphate isomerase/epimerase [Catalinimonas alkaloidigena]MDF9797550.1 sugar phosphate isomerase/epimerase [Catalinimonas alkaloidigena]
MAYLSRRSFLSSMLSVVPLHFAATKKPFRQENIMDKVGLHLGCIVDELIKRPQETLAFIHTAGIRHLELSDPALLKQLHPILIGMGFQLHATHFPSPYLTGNWQPFTAFGSAKPSNIKDFKELVNEAVKYEIPYLVFPNIFPQDRGDLEWYKNFASQLNEGGEICKNMGVQLCYHNHSFEFQPTENTSPIEVMLNVLNPELVQLELDIFWCGIADINIEDFISKYDNYISLLHLGDISDDTAQIYRAVSLPQKTFKAIGEGKINFDSILKVEALSDVPYYFLNLQQSDDIFKDISNSIDYLERL